MFFKVAEKGRNQFGIYLATLALVFLATMIGNVPLMIAMWIKGDGEIAQFTEVSDIYNLGLDQNLMLALIIVPFAFGLLALLLSIKTIHERRINSVLTARPKVDWNRILLVFGLWFTINGIFELTNYFMSPDEYSFRPPGISFIILLLVSFVFLPLQVAFEEVLFRGYLMQGIGAIFRNRWVPLILTSVAFGLMHMANPEVVEYGVGRMMTYYIGIGLVLGVVTIMDDGLELAFGIHAATNIYSATMVSYEAGAIQTGALFHSNADIVDNSIYSFLIFSIVFVFILSRIYKWNDWSKLWAPLPPKEEIIEIT